MKRVSFFIDGFNVYHSLKAKSKYRKYLWLDYESLCNKYVQKHKGEALGDVFYFTAFVFWKQAAEDRHKRYISALSTRGVKTVLGRYKQKDKYCKICKKTSKGYEEKQTDVNLSISLLAEAVKGTYDKAIIVTNDSDIIPAVTSVKSIFPGKKIGVLFPIERHSNELKNACDFHLSMRKYNLGKSQLPDKIKISENEFILKPQKFKN